MTTIITKNSSTASAVPVSGDLTQGELAVNVTDKKLYTKNSGGSVVELGTNPGSLTLSGGTANGVLYLNGSKVATSGSALTFDGTTFATTGAANFATSSGNVGIGTSSPAQRFQVYDATGGNNIIMATQGNAASIFMQGTSSTGDIGTINNYPVRFLQNNTERMRINSSGNVGIGTSSPNKRLTVYSDDGYIQMLNASTGTGNTDGSFIGVEGGTTALRIVNQENDVISFHTNGLANERMRIDASGNVGVRASSGLIAPLTVQATSQSTSTPLLYMRQGGSSPSYGYVFKVDNSSTGNLFLRRVGSGDVEGSDLVTLTPDGYLLINQTSNVTSSYLQIKGAQPAISCESTSTGSVSQVLFRNPNGQVGSIGTSGTSTSYNTSSDYRLKENIAPMTGALAKVAALNPVTYNWKVDGSAGQGFIAHELQAVVPDCVTGEKDAVDAEGKPQYQGVDTSFLVATLTAAIKEQQAIIEQQSQAIASLTTRIAALEAK